MVLVRTLLEAGSVRKLVAALDVLDLHVAERLPVRTEAHDVVRAARDERLRAVEFHVVAAKEAVEKELCDGALVRRLDGLVVVGLRPLHFWLALQRLQEGVRPILLLHKVRHVLAIDLARLLGVLAFEEADLDAVAVGHPHVRHRVVLSALQHGCEGLERLVPHLLEEEGELELALIKFNAHDAVHALQHLVVLVRHHGAPEIVVKPAVCRVREPGVPLLERLLRAGLRHKLDGAGGRGVQRRDVHLVDLLIRRGREVKPADSAAEAAAVGVLPQVVLRLRRQLGDGLQQGVRPNVLRNRAERALAANVRAKLLRKLAAQLVAQLPERVHVLDQVGAHRVAKVDLVVLVLQPKPAHGLLVSPPLPRPPRLARVELRVVGLAEPVHVRLQRRPRHVPVEAAQDLVLISAVLQVPVRQEALARLETERRARRGERAHGDQAAVAKHEVAPREADELAVGLQLVRRDLPVVREDAVHRLDGVKLASVVRVDVQRLALLALLARIDLLRDRLPRLNSTPHEAAAQVLDGARDELRPAAHVPEADGVHEKPSVRPEDGARLQIHGERACHVVGRFRDR